MQCRHPSRYLRTKISRIPSQTRILYTLYFTADKLITTPWSRLVAVRSVAARSVAARRLPFAVTLRAGTRTLS